MKNIVLYRCEEDIKETKDQEEYGAEVSITAGYILEENGRFK